MDNIYALCCVLYPLKCAQDVYFFVKWLLLVQYWWYRPRESTIWKSVKYWYTDYTFNSPTQLLW